MEKRKMTQKLKAGDVINWVSEDPDNNGHWELLETPDCSGLFAKSFLAKHLDTGEEAYITPNWEDIQIVKVS